MNHAQGIDGVRVSLLFKEVEPDVMRISLRSDGSVDVAEIASNHGGGGHPRAAGVQIEGPVETAARSSHRGDPRGTRRGARPMKSAAMLVVDKPAPADVS